jgi:hypothetical protein
LLNTLRTAAIPAVRAIISPARPHPIAALEPLAVYMRLGIPAAAAATEEPADKLGFDTLT